MSPLISRLLAAIGAGPQIEVQMVAVEGVGVGAEADAEAAAAGIVGRAQEAAHVLVVAVPARRNGDPPAVGGQEGADVHRVRLAVLAEPRAGLAVDRPAAVGAEALDLHDRAPE